METLKCYPTGKYFSTKNRFNDLKTYHSISIKESNFAKSKLWRRFDLEKTKEVFKIPNLIRYYHFDSVKPRVVHSNPTLQKIIRVIGTSVTDDNKEFVSIGEHKDLPFYFFQWHPEASQFLRGHTMSGSSHNMEGLKLLSSLIFEFVGLNEQERKYNIRNFPRKFEKFLSYKYDVQANKANAFGTGLVYLPRYTKDEASL
jgi:hypothetical protein